MSELKTLKDLKEFDEEGTIYSETYEAKTLKAEAVKWVKELKNLNFLPKKENVDWFLNEDDKISIRVFIRYFFNLTEEDLG